METPEYLISYGNAVDFGRFQCDQPLQLRRGDRAIVQSQRGLEIGAVLCQARPGHTRLLADRHVA